MKKIFVILTVLFLLSGCGSNSNSNSLEKIISENNYTVVDVRTNEEYDEGHVVGAVNIPYDTIDEDVELDKSKTILVYCRSGKRSSVAYNTLKGLGYDVVDLGSYDKITLEKE